MQYIQYIEESKLWTCPKTGKYKITCVGGGGTGILYTWSAEAVTPYLYKNGGSTSFGKYLTALGSQIKDPQCSIFTDTTRHVSSYDNFSSFTNIGGYGGYDGVSYGGNPESVLLCGVYNQFINGSIGGNSGGSTHYCPPDKNGGSISDANIPNNYGAGGFSKVKWLTATKLSTLQFTLTGYYQATQYKYQYINSPYQAPSTVTNWEYRTIPAGSFTVKYYGDGHEFMKKEMTPSEIASTGLSSSHGVRVATSTTTSTGPHGTSTYETYSDVSCPVTKYVLSAAPVVTTSKDVTPLFPVKARNNGGMKINVVELTEGENVVCTVGAGGKAINAGLGSMSDKSYLNSGVKTDSTVGSFSDVIGDGTDGVIIIQYLGG